MRVDRSVAQNLIVTLLLLLGLTFSTDGMAQSVNFQIGFKGSVDCERPFQVRDVPISGDGTGTLNADGSITADVTQTAFILSTTIHFQGRLGAPPTSAPGGTAQARVTGRNSLRLIWNLPNNALVVNIAIRGQSCSASFASNLKPGKSQHTLFDGSNYHYCGRPRTFSSSCQVR